MKRINDDHAAAVMKPLNDRFTREELADSVERVRHRSDVSRELRRSLGSFYLPSKLSTAQRGV